jgi:excinuclease UvrABC nuclease subunit
MVERTIIIGVKSIDELERGKIAIIGIAKGSKSFYPGDSIPLYLDKKSETLKVIQQLRNEAHRLGLHITAISGAKQHFLDRIDSGHWRKPHFNSAL